MPACLVEWKILADLPSGIKCANKIGENDSCQNDVAIVYGKRQHILYVFFYRHMKEAV